MMTKTKAALGAVGGLALAVGLMVAPNVARATPVPASGSFSFSSFDGATANTSDLITATAVTINDVFEAQGNGSGNLSSIAVHDTVSVNGGATSATFTVFAPGTGAHALGAPLSVAVHGFTLDLTSELTVNRGLTGIGSGEALTLAFIGTISGPGLATGTTASVLFGFTQAGGSGASISYSASAANPNTIATPEPASMALLGTGLLGMGLIRRRKQG